MKKTKTNETKQKRKNTKKLFNLGVYTTAGTFITRVVHDDFHRFLLYSTHSPLFIFKRDFSFSFRRQQTTGNTETCTKEDK